MINSVKKLKSILSLTKINFIDDNDPILKFPIKVSEDFASKIEKGNIEDPLLLQILPSNLENKKLNGFKLDPLDEKKYSPIPGLIHKYKGRVLLLVTNCCAIKCRFCFRKHSIEKVINWTSVFSYIINDNSIQEVILSGGDPMTLPYKKLKFILDELLRIKHLNRIRIHTRVPIVMPKLIKDNFFENFKSKIIFVVHCNHPNEIDNNVKIAINILLKNNILVFNQTVLLRKVNDDSDILIDLSKKLFSIGIIPYYLHMLDHVDGSTHFYVSTKKAKKIYENMKKELPGYLVPKLVKETNKGKEYV